MDKYCTFEIYLTKLIIRKRFNRYVFKKCKFNQMLCGFFIMKGSFQLPTNAENLCMGIFSPVIYESVEDNELTESTIPIIEDKIYLSCDDMDDIYSYCWENIININAIPELRNLLQIFFCDVITKSGLNYICDSNPKSAFILNNKSIVECILGLLPITHETESYCHKLHYHMHHYGKNIIFYICILRKILADSLIVSDCIHQILRYFYYLLMYY